MTKLFGILLASLIMTNAIGEDAKTGEKPRALDFSMNSLAGEKVNLTKYKGKVILAVNVASYCGYTGQYKGLQELYETFKDEGLVILGIPCNQFGSQEPGSSKEIAEFCSSKYGVSFDMLEKVEVNGNGACDLYKYLTSLDLKPAGKGKIGWNFEKFLFDRDGQVVARYKSGTAPDSKELVSAIEGLLKK